MRSFTRRHAFVGELHQAALTRQRVLENAGRCSADYATQGTPERDRISSRSRLSTLSQTGELWDSSYFPRPAYFSL
ncbi:hypothetical protein IG631_14864 [Alternaria alternata]|nr:hypothetical protein IG631_14864 [Alternaria alternata]